MSRGSHTTTSSPCPGIDRYIYNIYNNIYTYLHPGQEMSNAPSSRQSSSPRAVCATPRPGTRQTASLVTNLCETQIGINTLSAIAPLCKIFILLFISCLFHALRVVFNCKLGFKLLFEIFVGFLSAKNLKTHSSSKCCSKCLDTEKIGRASQFI